MKTLKNKSKISAITFVLLLTFAAVLVALPIVSAADPPLEIPVWCYVTVTNNPIGVNQQLVIVYWVNSYPPTANGAYGDRWTYYVKITTPSQSTDTLGPFTSDPVGAGWALYTPTEVGTYTIVAEFQEHKITGEPFPPGWSPYSFGYSSLNDTYIATNSDPLTLTVQEEPIDAWREPPVTTDYWERPINSMNREWYRLAGNWLGGAAQNVGPTSNFAYGKAPETAHIMWSTQIWDGGIMDERFGNIGYQTAHYEGIEFNPPIILNGRIYYNTPIGAAPTYGWHCRDLYTGEYLFFHNTSGPVTNVGGGFDYSGEVMGEKLSFGQIYNYESPNQHGGLPYLWSMSHPTEPNTFMMFDAFTGNWICNINNAPMSVSMFGTMLAGTSVYGKDGSILQYIIKGTPGPSPYAPAGPPFYLQVWNTSRAIWYEESWGANEYWMWRPELGVTFDGNNGYSLNVSIPAVQGSIRAIREGEYIIGGTSGNNRLGMPLELGNMWALSLKKGQEGTLLWNYTFTPPYSEISSLVSGGFFGGGLMGLTNVDPEDGVFLFYQGVTREYWCYDLETGELLWGPSDPEPGMNFYTTGMNIYQGKLLSTGYGGEMIAYNITTGEVLWKYIAAQEGYESPYGNYPIGIACISDGKIFLSSSEHSPTQPLWRGSRIRCVNATDGEEIWSINHWCLGASHSTQGPGSGIYVADGYVVSLNAYDNQIYCYGRGPSATTVTGTKSAVSLGSSVMIEGTVTDQSPGAAGTPAMSDEDMTAWMEYLYMQQAKPKDAQGVTVKLTSIDPNGNYQDIGEVTTDIWGNFGKSWVPPVPGDYVIMAEFEGSGAYGSSSASTYMVVDPAPSPAVPIEPEPTAPAPTEPIPTEPAPTEPEPTEPVPTEPEPTEPEPTEPAEAPFITTEIAIIIAVVVVAVVGIVAFWMLRKRK